MGNSYTFIMRIKGLITSRLTTARRVGKPWRFVSVASIALAAACLQAPVTANAQTLDDLQVTYQAAVAVYNDALDAQAQNEAESVEVDAQIEQLREEIAADTQRLNETAVKLYKENPGRGKLIDMILDTNSLDDAIACYDSYARIQQYYMDSIASVKEKRSDLELMQAKLERTHATILDDVENARLNALEAQEAYLDADHSDGSFYHQLQGNGSNCGATAFIVGVNILLHSNMFNDNVAVWSGPGFEGDSTTALGYKGAIWLAANGLSDQISVRTITGDIHTADELQYELEQGRVVVISSGSGSIWHYADGSATPGSFPYGHWIVFYCYQDGVFYANDSSASTRKGAGCPYTTVEMQRWLDGRSYHYAVSLERRRPITSEWK